jgi:hypothetical protein
MNPSRDTNGEACHRLLAVHALAPEQPQAMSEATAAFARTLWDILTDRPAYGCLIRHHLTYILLTVSAPQRKDASVHPIWQRIPLTAATQCSDIRSVGSQVVCAVDLFLWLHQSLRIFRGRFCLLSPDLHSLFQAHFYTSCLLGHRSSHSKTISSL